MALGNNIVLTPDPRGRYIEAVNGTEANILPGTCVQWKSGSSEDAGHRKEVEPYDVAASGVPKLVMVVDAEFQIGQTADDPILPGKRLLLYIPNNGDELNMLVQDQSGTGATSDFSVGDPLMIEDGTGLLIDGALGTLGYATPFEVQENYSDMAADTRLHVMFTGR